jgi:hypothetical protein
LDHGSFSQEILKELEAGLVNTEYVREVKTTNENGQNIEDPASDIRPAFP